MSTIAWIGFCQSMFAAILMFTKKGRSLPDKILSIWLLLIAIDFMICGLEYEIIGKPMLSSSFLLFNPFIYLYIRSLTQPNYRLNRFQALHLLPFIVFELLTYSFKEKFSLDTFFIHDADYLFRLFFGSAILISWCSYIPLSLIMVHKHRMFLRNEWSNIEKNESLSWLLAFAVFYVVYCMFAVIITYIAYYNQLNPFTPHIYNYSTLLLLVYIISFYGLRQQVPTKRMNEDDLQMTPYKNSTLSDESKQNIQKNIIHYFKEEKAYLNPDLDMQVLSTHLKIPKYQITEVLNTNIGMNFFQFVNSYRVEEVRRMLANPNNKYSIEAIGYECGFTSKSSFYTVFKNITGDTPVAYRNKIKQ